MEDQRQLPVTMKAKLDVDYTKEAEELVFWLEDPEEVAVPSFISSPMHDKTYVYLDQFRQFWSRPSNLKIVTSNDRQPEDFLAWYNATSLIYAEKCDMTIREVRTWLNRLYFDVEWSEAILASNGFDKPRENYIRRISENGVFRIIIHRDLLDLFYDLGKAKLWYSSGDISLGYGGNFSEAAIRRRLVTLSADSRVLDEIFIESELPGELYHYIGNDITPHERGKNRGTYVHRDFLPFILPYLDLWEQNPANSRNFDQVPEELEAWHSLAESNGLIGCDYHLQKLYEYISALYDTEDWYLPGERGEYIRFFVWPGNLAPGFYVSDLMIESLRQAGEFQIAPEIREIPLIPNESPYVSCYVLADRLGISWKKVRVFMEAQIDLDGVQELFELDGKVYTRGEIFRRFRPKHAPHTVVVYGLNCNETDHFIREHFTPRMTAEMRVEWKLLSKVWANSSPRTKEAYPEGADMLIRLVHAILAFDQDLGSDSLEEFEGVRPIKVEEGSTTMLRFEAIPGRPRMQSYPAVTVEASEVAAWFMTSKEAIFVRKDYIPYLREAVVRTIDAEKSLNR